MKRVMLILLAACMVVGSTYAQGESFDKAREAYDEGRYGEAVLSYQSLLEEGYDNPEIHYNLANAFFKDSDLPNAVWHYRVAWMEKPRDPDIRANLHFALNAAGAVESNPTFLENAFATLSKSEWIVVAVVGYTLLALILALMLAWKSARRFLLKASLIPVAALLAAGVGWWHWHLYDVNPEWVVVRTETTALYGPVEGSTAHFKLPLGALARQQSIDPKGWVEIIYDGKSGWIQADYIKRVSP